MVNSKFIKLFLIVISIFAVLSAGAITVYQKQALEETRLIAQERVILALERLDYYKHKASIGALTPDQARFYALDAINKYLANEDSYYWVIGTDSVGLMHPHYPELKGQDLNKYPAPDGQYIFKDMARMATSDGDGFLRYDWSKPSTKNDNSYNKLSYVKLYAPWGWVVGSGIYLDSVSIFSFLNMIVATLIFFVLIFFIISSIKDKDDRQVMSSL